TNFEPESPSSARSFCCSWPSLKIAWASLWRRAAFSAVVESAAFKRQKHPRDTQITNHFRPSFINRSRAESTAPPCVTVLDFNLDQANSRWLFISSRRVFHPVL